jgi:hypothetical protein
LGALQWVLSRPLYRFRRFDLKNLTKAQQSQALRLQIGQWSPYVRSGQYVVWEPEHALVWAWDADRLDADLAGQKLKPKTTRIIPESLLHSPLPSGLRLVTCLDGVEGQLWQNQRLVHSRWWKAPPNTSEWHNFQRDAGLAPDQGEYQGVPTPAALPWQKQPWAKSADLSRSQNQTLPHEIWLIGGTLLLLAGFTTSYGIELVKTRLAVAQLKLELDTATQNARPVLEARRTALEALTRIETLQATHPYPEPLALFAEVAKQLPRDSSYLKEWNYQNGRLKINIASPNKLPSSFVVKKLQDTGWFNNVQAVPATDPTVLTLTMETLPQNEIRLNTVEADEPGSADKREKSGTLMKSSPKP